MMRRRREGEVTADEKLGGGGGGGAGGGRGGGGGGGRRRKAFHFTIAVRTPHAVDSGAILQLLVCNASAEQSTVDLHTLFT